MPSPVPKFYDPFEYWDMTHEVYRMRAEDAEKQRMATAEAMERSGAHACTGMHCRTCHPALPPRGTRA